MENNLIYIEKRSVTENGLPAADKAEYIPGIMPPAGYSLPVEYNIEGFLDGKIEVGKRVLVYRTKRNGIVCSGLFETSTVTKLNKEYFTTKNSVYYYKFL